MTGLRARYTIGPTLCSGPQTSPVGGVRPTPNKERPTARARRLSSPIKGRGAGARVEQPMASCAFFHKYKSRPSGDPNFYLRDPKCSAGKVARSARLVPKGPGRAARSAGDLVQWVERMFCTHEATGSSPVVSKNAHGCVFFFSALLKDQKKGRSLTRVPSRACDQVWWDSVGMTPEDKAGRETSPPERGTA